MSSDFRKIVTAAVGVSANASDDEIATALADLLRPKVEQRQLAEQAEHAKSFSDLVASVIASENISYSEAASKVSRERPDLYFAHREQASLN
jgi:hypothetical protein